MPRKRSRQIVIDFECAGGDGVGSFAAAIQKMMQLKAEEKKNDNKKSAPGIVGPVVHGGVCIRSNSK